MELSIDTAGAVGGVALTESGTLLADLAWRTRAGHAADLLPAIASVLEWAGARQRDLDAIFVCQGPGGYAGLRVGISTAMGLAYALGAGLLGVNRLEADAYVHAAFPGPVVPVHSAGRGEFAWCVYEDGVAVATARLTPPEDLLEGAPPGVLLCGEVEGELAEKARTARPDLHVLSGPAFTRRAITIAALAWPRYAAGERDDPATLEPVYLREPHITISRAQRARENAVRPDSA